MRLHGLSLALLLTFSAAAAEAPLPDLRTEPTTGGSIFTVKNTYTQPLDAFLIELVDYPGSTYSFTHDQLGADAIAAGAEKKITVANMTVGAAPDHVKVLAAIYEDGTTVGAPDKVQHVLDGRRNRLEITRQIIQRIEQDQKSGKDKTAVVADLREWAPSFVAQPAGSKEAVGTAAMARRNLVLVSAGHVNTQSVEAELANLHKTESALAASKPSLN